MRVVERHIIKSSNKYWKEIDELAFKSKNLYNLANYYCRQRFFETGRSLSLTDLYHATKSSDAYRALPTKVSKQIIKRVTSTWRGYFQGHKEWRKYPEKFFAEPKIPKYKDKQKGRNVVIYSHESVYKLALKQGICHLSMSDIQIPTKVKKVVEVRIVPATACYFVEIVYELPEQQSVNSDYVAGVDLGIDRLIALSTNKPGVRPLLINGKPLKSVNQHYNKLKAKHQSYLTGKRRTSKKIESLTYYRNRFVDNYLHQTSRIVVDYLVEHNIRILVIGKNDNWKQKVSVLLDASSKSCADFVNIGKRNNQQFTQIPHSKLVQQLTYKCQLVGIEVIQTEESYTSKTSALDLEKPCKHETYKGRRVNGVGGLSVVNALAGAYAEEVPVIVISGAPRTSAKGNKLLMHHTTGDYNLQYSILEKVTVAAITLTNAEQAPAQIDRTIAACLRYKRPVYIEIPADMVSEPCVIPFSFERPNPLVSDLQALNEAINEAVEWLENAERPVILAGVELHRYGLHKKLHQLVEITGYPIASTLLGKSSISELHPQFIGNYAGALSRDYVKNRVETADCVLCLGAIMSDINLGGYTAELKESQLINANSEKVKIKHHYYYPVDLGDFMEGLIGKLSHKPYESLAIQPASQLLSKSFQVQPEQKITNARFYERMNHFVSENSTVIAETGDAIIATIDLLIHEDTRFIGQAFYMSIGYSLPACLGAALAAPQNRVILFIGDGSFQMTCQELSTIIRLGLNPIIFLINNDGYTVERMIHDGDYNDIQHTVTRPTTIPINCLPQ